MDWSVRGRHSRGRLGVAPMLVLLDADRDCPVAIAAGLLKRCNVAHADLRVSVVVAKCEYEAWFLAAATSLCRDEGLSNGEVSPAEPEQIRNAKGWLSDRMSFGGRYVETRHQAKFSRLMDLESARRASSFGKLEREIAIVVGADVSSISVPATGWITRDTSHRAKVGGYPWVAAANCSEVRLAESRLVRRSASGSNLQDSRHPGGRVLRGVEN